MKMLFLPIALAMSATAYAQATPEPPPTQADSVQSPVAVPRDEAVAPPGYNAASRNVAPAQAQQIIGQLSSYDYPPCSRRIQDRCIQAYERGVTRSR